MSGGKEREQKHVRACVCVRESASCGRCDESGELMSGWSAASVRGEEAEWGGVKGDGTVIKGQFVDYVL